MGETSIIMAENHSNKEIDKKQSLTSNVYIQIIVTLIFIIVAFLLGIIALELYDNTPQKGLSIIKTPEIIASPNPIPDVTDILQMSEDFKALTPNEEELTLLHEDKKKDGIYCISKENERYLIYDIDINNIGKRGYKLNDFTNIWVYSEDSEFYAVLNISGEKVDLSGFYILVYDESDKYASQLVINCYEAKEVVLKDTVVTGTLLAPNAHVVYDNTYVYGQVQAYSYEGYQKYFKEILFTGYSEIMNDLTYADINVDAVRIAAIEFLMENDPYGTYSHYNTGSKLRLKDTNAITSLKLDDNELTIGGEKVDEIGADLALFEGLTSLSISDTNLAKIDLSYVPHLTKLSINNTELAEINLEPVPSLEELYINKSQIKSIDLSFVPNIIKLSLDENELTELDLSKQTGLLDLSIDNTKIKSLDLSQNKNIVNLSYSGTKIPLPDFKTLPALIYLNCSNTDLKAFPKEVAESIKYLDVSNNKNLSSADLSVFPSLAKLDISNCSLTGIDLSKTSVLTYLIASHNKFKTVDLSVAPSILSAEIYGDTVKSINITGKSHIHLLCSDSVELIGKEVIENAAETP